MAESTRIRIAKLYREGKAFLNDEVAKQWADFYFPLEVAKPVKKKKEDEAVTKE